MRGVGSACLSALVLCGCVSGSVTTERVVAADATEGQFTLSPFEWDGVVAAGERVSVDNGFGDLRVRSAEGRHAVVSAQIQRFAGDDVDIAVVVKRVGDTLDIRVAEKALVEDTRAHGTIRGSNGQFDGRVDMALLLPHSVPLEAGIAAGLMHLKSYRGPASLRSDSGRILATSPTALQVLSDSGDVKISFVNTHWERAAEISTRSGDIAIVLPKHPDVAIEASTGGELVDQLSVPMMRHRNTGSVTLGDGSGRLIVKSTSGSVLLSQENARLR
ncbi:MAG: DUF4097 domain-containing protein [Gammaproteobacteria bacterium]|nr:DUF4097 domain-containing protein [Gammaproteobacteria bacterium]